MREGGIESARHTTLNPATSDDHQQKSSATHVSVAVRA